MNAEIVTTGTELLLGEIVDTNAAYIARQLREVGVNLYYKTTVGDNRERLAQVLQQCLQRSDVIIVTGGLGPTVDDITREAVADATGRPLQQRPELVRDLQGRFASWGRTMSENNLRQSFLPRGATAIPNPIGTAAGFIVETEMGAIICLPGVPHEMKRMMADRVLPYLQQRMGSGGGVILTRILHTAGIGESAIDDRIGHLMTSGNPTVGLAAHMGQVDIRLAARAATRAEAEAIIAPVEAEVRGQLAHWIYGADDETLAGVVARLLRQQGGSLAVVETNTDGRLAHSFQGDDTNILRASFRAGTLEALAASLDLAQPPAPDEASAVRMARRLRERTGATHTVIILGSSDPSHGFWSTERGVSYVAYATPGGTHSERYPVGGTDEFTASWLTIQVLNTLRKYLRRDEYLMPGRPVPEPSAG